MNPVITLEQYKDFMRQLPDPSKHDGSPIAFNLVKPPVGMVNSIETLLEQTQTETCVFRVHEYESGLRQRHVCIKAWVYCGIIEDHESHTRMDDYDQSAWIESMFIDLRNHRLLSKKNFSGILEAFND